MPFDLESTWSAAVLTVVANVVDPSMFDGCHGSLQIAYSLLGEMHVRGNHVAGLYRDELTLLQRFLSRLERDSTRPASFPDPAAASLDDSTGFTSTDADVNDWWSDNIMNADQLNAVADSISLDDLEWLISGSF